MLHRITNPAQLHSPGKGLVDFLRAGVHTGVSVPALQTIRPQCHAPKVVVAVQNDAERPDINSSSPTPGCSISCYSKTPLRPTGCWISLQQYRAHHLPPGSLPRHFSFKELWQELLRVPLRLKLKQNNSAMQKPRGVRCWGPAANVSARKHLPYAPLLFLCN